MRLADEQVQEPLADQRPYEVFEAQEMAAEVPDWTLHNDRLERQLSFPTFEEAVEFVMDVARVAIETNHHPDIHISYNKVRLSLSTHKIGGLSRSDFIVAARIDDLARQPQPAS